MLIEKKYKVKDDGEKFELILSISFYWIYILCFLVAAENVSTIYKLSNLEWYIIYTYIGMISVVWCYFSWRLKWNARPQFAKNEKEMILDAINRFGDEKVSVIKKVMPDYVKYESIRAVILERYIS